jgi:hypothetical protein
VEKQLLRAREKENGERYDRISEPRASSVLLSIALKEDTSARYIGAGFLALPRKRVKTCGALAMCRLTRKRCGDCSSKRKLY